MQRDVIFTCLLVLLSQSSRLQAEEVNSSDIFRAKDFSSVAECGCTLFQLQMSTPSHQHHDVMSSQRQQLDEVDERKWMQKSRKAEAEVVILREQLKSQLQLKLQVEVEVRREVAKDSADLVRMNEKLSQENLNLKQQITDTASCKTDVISQMQTTNKDILDQLISVNISVVQSNNEICDKIQKVGAKLTSLVSRLEEVEAALKSLEISTSQQPSTVTQKTPCETTDLTTTALDGKQYFFSYDQRWMNWSDAQTFCRSHHMDLVSVETQDEWRALKPEVQKLKSKVGNWPWSSATDSAQEGKWIWGSGRDVTFYALQSMSNRENEDCMYLYTEWWDDLPCATNMPFICEVNLVC